MFQATITDRLPRTIIALEGELDLASTPQLLAIVSGVMAAGSGEIVLDMAELTFIDSTGFSGVATLAEQARSSGASLELRSPSELTAQVLEVTGLDRVITVRAA